MLGRNGPSGARRVSEHGVREVGRPGLATKAHWLTPTRHIASPHTRLHRWNASWTYSPAVRTTSALCACYCTRTALVIGRGNLTCCTNSGPASDSGGTAMLPSSLLDVFVHSKLNKPSECTAGSFEQLGTMSGLLRASGPQPFHIRHSSPALQLFPSLVSAKEYSCAEAACGL